MSFLYSGSLWSSLYCGISSLCVGLYRWHIIFDSSLLWSFIFLCCLLWSLHSLVLLIWSFSLYFLMSLANGLSILFILSKNQLLALLIFAMVCLEYFNWREQTPERLRIAQGLASWWLSLALRRLFLSLLIWCCFASTASQNPLKALVAQSCPTLCDHGL